MAEFELVELKRQPACSRLVDLPPELQREIMGYLSYFDLQELSHVNRYYRTLLTFDFKRQCYTSTQWREELSHVCGHCHRAVPKEKSLFFADVEDLATPLGADCLGCTVKHHPLYDRTTIYTKSKDNENAYITRSVCRWCAWPVTEGELHEGCVMKYLGILAFSRFLIHLQWALTWTACGLAWSTYHQTSKVLLPTVVST